MHEKILAEKIRDLCDKAAQNISISEHGIRTGPGYGDSRIVESGIRFHELDKEGIFNALLGLSKILSPTPNLSFISEDHFHLWSWCAEVFANANSPANKGLSNPVKALMSLVSHTALSRGGIGLRYTEGKVLGVHSRVVLAKTSESLQYLVFPFLEALLRYVCSEYISSDGVVRKEFLCQSWQKNYKVDKRCNNLGDVLTLYRESSKDVPARRVALDLLNQIEISRPNNNLAGWLYDCRNGAMHGEDYNLTTSAIVLNICFGLCLGELSDETYKTERDRIMQIVSWNLSRETRPDWSYYPLDA
jgi:hypothetical protein